MLDPDDDNYCTCGGKKPKGYWSGYRGVEGTILLSTRVSEPAVTSETAEERTLRRDAATEGAAAEVGPFRGMGTLFWRVVGGVVVDLLGDEESLGVDMLGSKKAEGGVALDNRRVGGFATLRLLTWRGLATWVCGTGVALGERGAEPFLGDPFALRPPGTMVVTPLTLLEREAEE